MFWMPFLQILEIYIASSSNTSFSRHEIAASKRDVPRSRRLDAWALTIISPCLQCARDRYINQSYNSQITVRSSKTIPMADGLQHPHSDTLAPPRKSVELEDPGAHELSERSLSADRSFSSARPQYS